MVLKLIIPDVLLLELLSVLMKPLASDKLLVKSGFEKIKKEFKKTVMAICLPGFFNFHFYAICYRFNLGCRMSADP